MLCDTNGGWTPCRGGVDAGISGSGYCEPGYHGPLCKLCDGPAYSRYFDKLDARCKSCGNVSVKSSIAFSILALVCLVAAGGGAVAFRRGSLAKARRLVLKRFRSMQKLYRRAGGRFLLKTFVGAYQCVAAVPSVYHVVTPDGL